MCVQICPKRFWFSNDLSRCLLFLRQFERIRAHTHTHTLWIIYFYFCLHIDDAWNTLFVIGAELEHEDDAQPIFRCSKGVSIFHSYRSRGMVFPIKKYYIQTKNSQHNFILDGFFVTHTHTRMQSQIHRIKHTPKHTHIHNTTKRAACK